MFNVFQKNSVLNGLSFVTSTVSLFLTYASIHFASTINIIPVILFFVASYLFYILSCEQISLLSFVTKLLLKFSISLIVVSYCVSFFEITSNSTLGLLLYNVVVLFFSPAHQLKVTPVALISFKEYLHHLDIKSLLFNIFLSLGIFILILTVVSTYVFHLSTHEQYLLSTNPTLYHTAIITYFSLVQILPTSSNKELKKKTS